MGNIKLTNDQIIEIASAAAHNFVPFEQHKTDDGDDTTYTDEGHEIFQVSYDTIYDALFQQFYVEDNNMCATEKYDISKHTYKPLPPTVRLAKSEAGETIVVAAQNMEKHIMFGVIKQEKYETPLASLCLVRSTGSQSNANIQGMNQLGITVADILEGSPLILRKGHTNWRKEISIEPTPQYGENEWGCFTVKRRINGEYVGLSHVTKDYWTKLHRTIYGGFLNHSETPNCTLEEVTKGHYYLKCLTDIEANTELTINYAHHPCG